MNKYTPSFIGGCLALATCAALPAQTPLPATAAIRALANNQYVTAAGSTTSLIANSAGGGGTTQQFDVVNLGNGNIALRAHSDNLYVTAENAGASPLIANRTAVGPWETFQEVTVSGGVALKAQANGMYVCADNAGASPLIANRTVAGPWETFVFETPGVTSQAAAPTFSPGGGTYTSAQNVTLTTATSGASIRYTTDGSTPTATSGTIYSGPVNISATTTLNAIAYESGFTGSAVASATYIINSSTSGGDVVGKITVGYQGWFACIGDGAPINGWWHWSQDWSQSPSPSNNNLKAWPDMREYSAKYQTAYANLGDGEGATLFSSYDQQTVNTHFLWMQQNGCDTAALQRFDPNSAEGPTRDAVAANVRAAAEAYGRKFYIMYDATGWTNMQSEMKADWTNKMSALTASPAYARQNGKPVVGIWGFGFNDSNHPWSAAVCLDVVTWFQSQGCYVMGGVPREWRTGTGGSRSGYLGVYHAFNMLSPWMVGAIGTGADSDNAYSTYTVPDLADCRANGVDYQPCVLPGDLSEHQRVHGDFMWRQFYNMVRAGCSSIYISMFDEYGEGNQIAKTAENSSMNPSNSGLLTLDEDGTACSSDYYLRLTADGGKMLKGQIGLTATRPTSPEPSGTTTPPPGNSGSAPYGGSPAAVPGTVQAENYDTGGQGAAYNVTSINGQANSYRSDGVDLETTSDAGGGYDLGWTAGGQWFKYTVNVATAGTYTVSFRVAAPSAVTDAFHLSNASGTNLSGSVNLPATGGWQTWTTVTASVSLAAGQQVLTLNQDNGGWNINELNFTTSASGGGTIVSNYPTMYLRGTMNNWGTTAMTLVANNTWQVTVSLSAGTTYQYKYDASGVWTATQNWGVGNTPGVGGVNAANIFYMTGAAGNYVFQFNDSTLQYSITPPATQSPGEAPYGGSPAAIPGTVQAENYDTGGQGAAYNVTSINGQANSYRSDGVDLETTSDAGGGYDLGWTAGGQWFNYTVNVATAGTYTVSFRVAAPSTVTDAFHLSNASGTNLSGSVNLPATGGWQTWTTVTASVNLAAGQQILTLNEDNGGWNINDLTFGVSTPPNQSAPPTPTGVTATAGANQVALSWSASSGATSYNVYRSTGSNGEGTTAYIAGLTGTSYTDTGVTAGTTYYYKVAAVSSAGSSSQSAEVSAAPTGGTSVPPNTALLQINAGGGAVTPFVADMDYSAGTEFSNPATITTSGVPNAAPAAVYQDVRWNASFNYTLPALTPGASYVVRLHFVELSFTAAGQRLFNVAINGTTVLSNFDIYAQVGQDHALVEQFIATANRSGQIVVAFTQGSKDNPSIAGIEVWTPAAIAAAPTGLSATGGNGQVNLVWNASAGATSYNVYRGTSSGGESATPIAIGVTGASYTDSTVTNGTSYYYKVAAVNTGGTSGLSNEASALPKVVPPNAPASPSAMAGFGNVTLSWSASQGATSYTIYRGTSAGGEGFTPYAMDITGTSFTDNNVTVGTTYYYTIVAVDSAGNSTASTEVSAAPLSVTGQGGSFPWTRYRAADSTVATYGGGATLETSPNFDKMNLATQASNQAYVQLSAAGAYVQWTVSQSNQAGVTMRFTLPDAANGYGQNGSVDCYVNGAKVQTISLTSYYAWQYFGGGGDPSDTPVSGDVPAFAFDEVHWLLATPLKSGDVIRIQSSGGPVVGVDFLEIESVPAPLPQPAGSVSVASYGAVAYGNNSAAYSEIAELQGGSGVTTAPGVTDSLAAFNAAVAAALASPSKTLYIPAGTYYLSGMWVIGSTGSPISQLTIVGAGIWYTNIQFTNPNVAGGGCSIRLAANGTMNYGNVYFNSMLRSRYNENAIYKCFMDNFGVNSNFHDLWEDHFECGYWVADYAYNPCQVASNLTIQNCRIRDNLADGVNFCNGTYNSTVTNCNIRNGGDDGLAVWPNNFNGAPMAVNDTFTHNTIEFEWRSAGLALYGGSGHQVTNNLVEDTFMSAGFRANSTFPGFQFQNNTGITVSNNTFICCGTSYDAWSGELGAIDLEASNTSIQNFTFSNDQVIDAQRDGYSFGFSGGFNGMLFNNCSANGTGLDGITTSKYTEAHLGAGICTYGAGSATFKSMTWANCAGGNVFNQGGFVLTFQ